jgi:hypothetical protein
MKELVTIANQYVLVNTLSGQTLGMSTHRGGSYTSPRLFSKKGLDQWLRINAQFAQFWEPKKVTLLVAE